MRTRIARDPKDRRTDAAKFIPDLTVKLWYQDMIRGGCVPAVVANVALCYADGYTPKGKVTRAYLDESYEKQLTRTDTLIEDELARRAALEGRVFRRHHTIDKENP